MNLNKLSQIYVLGEDSSKCGYCGKAEFASFGVWALKLTVSDYQAMCDRNWRRSGCFLYKPSLKTSCCPCYTIRLDILKFQLSKSQKKVLRSVRNQLEKGLRGEKDEEEEDNDRQSERVPDSVSPSSGEKGTDKIHNIKKPKTEHEIIPGMDSTKETTTKQQQQSPPNRHLPHRKKVAKENNKQQDIQSPQHRKSNGHIQTIASIPTPSSDSGITSEHSSIAQLSSYLEYSMESFKHELEISLHRATLKKESFLVYKKYQMSVHKDKEEKLTEANYKRFLVDTPLESEDPLLGTFHLDYRLDGKLIAVGVLDILPLCVSSVYFYYDPDYSSLNLGTYSALQEIALVNRLRETNPSIHYYYMGYYIHSCPKMAYKVKYAPSDLLDPMTCQWVPAIQCLKLLDQSKYCSFLNRENEEKEEEMKASSSLVNEWDSLTDIDQSKILMILDHTVMPFSYYQIMNKHDPTTTQNVLQCAWLLGPELFCNMLMSV